MEDTEEYEEETQSPNDKMHELERVRWDGKTSSPIGKTPFGFFDGDAEFVSFAPKAASCCYSFRISYCRCGDDRCSILCVLRRSSNRV